MGFIDLSRSSGRDFGSIGIALNEIVTRISLSKADKRQITGPSADRAGKCLTQLCKAFKVPDNLNIQVESAIPEHIGLGSGTQMALAVGSALNAFYGLGLSVRQIASVLDRGLRSGIGIGVFEQGGLVVDGGRGENTVTPPLLVRLEVPADWRFILVFDNRDQGLHGAEELAAFAALQDFPRREAEKFCYMLMMQALPAVVENEIDQFGAVITELQQAVGNHFASAQGGIYASKDVAEAMAWLQARGAMAVGQTSWGPTGFCAVADPEVANDLLRQAQTGFARLTNLHFMVVSANNLSAASRISIS
jgi:beta-RFAP synthase